MKHKRFLTAGLVAGVLSTAAACGSSSGTSSASSDQPTTGGSAAAGSAAGSAAPAAGGGSKTLKVWLMSGSAPDALVASLDSAFEAAHPGIKVDYQVQQWNGIQEKLTTAMSDASTTPDVIELGNTQNPSFSADGTLADLTDKVSQLGSTNWLAGLKDPGAYEGKQYGIPFYASGRVVIYRKDMFAKAGISAPPTSDAEWLSDIQKLNKAYAGQKDFQSLYLPGQSWYTYLSFLWDQGGDIAKQDGDSWTGTLDTPQAAAAADFYKQLVDTSKTTAPKDNDEANPQQYTVYSKGKTAMMIGLPWELGSAVADKGAPKDLKANSGVFAIPSKTAGKTAPIFLGGSNLAIPVNSKNQDLAWDWIKQLAGKDYQEQLAKANGVVPNDPAFNSVIADDPIVSVVAKAAAGGSKATPATPKWAAVEAQNPIKDFLTAVVTGKQKAADAAKTASQAITDKMSG
ncbi:N,N'-diacetylchitobiose transport system substrate-binding protein [Motilibacter rhizosphaerae]|uniref:N,N'-diacetylchitobiose transport system substrate-binding protein n=1 Tax=Motilibacter rhizosphaerae TaxID=598652 RepID=A0A4Q7NGI2_9ACTN|nr:extracellular solute-binding protein [Motilibacter rhizosphaerae]RZS82838.1 N,N'-diacetylchitobiose transport system substrate-binding protein [Motilibacter rhizosphaerae]